MDLPSPTIKEIIPNSSVKTVCSSTYSMVSSLFIVNRITTSSEIKGTFDFVTSVPGI